MQSFIIKKNIGNNRIDIFSKICIFFLLLTMTNKDLGNLSSLIYWGIVLSCLGCLFLRLCILKKDVVFTSYIWWYIVFIVICIASLLYSISVSVSIEILKTLVVNGAVLFCLAWMIETKDHLNEIMKILLLVTLCNAIYLCFTVDWVLMGVERLDAKEVGVGWNSNEIGKVMLWGSMICCYLAKEFKKTKYYLPLIVFVLLIIYSGSRTIWIGFCVFLMALVYISNKKNVFLSILILPLVLMGLYYLIINVEWLYNMGGSRMEELVQGYFGEGKFDSSAELRENYISYGFEWFAERPVFGYGIDTYRILLDSKIGRATYAHNNLVELLVNLGIVGTAVFYYIYCKILKMAYDCICIKKSSQSFSTYLMVVMGAVQLLMQYGSMQYQDLYSMILLLFVFYYFRLQNMNYKEGF